MSACWRCGFSSPSGANFCPSCGAELRSELPDLDLLIEPARVEDTAPVAAAGTATSPWVIAAAVAIVSGFVAFFALVGGDSGDDFPPVDPFEDRSDFDAVAVPTTGDPTTTEAIDEDDPDPPGTPPLEWSVALEVGSGFPVGLVDIGESTFLYAVDSVRSGSSRATYAYQRTPEGDWLDRGPVLGDGAIMNHVAPADDGLVAVGLDGLERPTIWRSSDGVTWSAETLPPADGDGASAVQPFLAAATDGITIVAGGAPLPWTRIQLAIEERFGPAADYANAEISSQATGVTVRGPFGLVMGEIELTDVGLSSLDVTSHFERPSSVWEDDGSGEWTTELASGQVLNLFAITDGPLVRNEGNNFGSTVSYRSRTGWTEPAEPGRLWRVEPWGKSLIGRDERGSVTVLSFDLETARPLPIPTSGDGISFMTASEDGLAVAEVVVDPGHEDRDRVVVLRNGFTLAADAGTLTLSEGTDVLFRGSLHWEVARDRYRVDDVGDEITVTFLDEDGSDLVGFTLDDLAQLQQATQSGWPGDTPALSVLASRDGERWAGGVIEAPAIGDLDLGRLHVDDGRVIAALQHDPSLASQAAGDTFVIIEAELPD